MLRTYKYLLRPTVEQMTQLDFLLWQSRLVYNTALEQRITTYRKTGKGIGYGAQWAHYRDVRRDSPDALGRVNASSLQHLLRRLQRHASRQVKGSDRQKKTYRMIAGLHERIANQRADYLHKVSAWLVVENDRIAIENLTLGFMNQNRHLALSSHDAGFGLFRQMLEYKAESAGIPVIAVNPANTTQACSGCGSIVPKGLSVRVHACPDCGLVLDRDVNAARNILSKALHNPPGRGRQVVTWAVAPAKFAGGLRRALPEKPSPPRHRLRRQPGQVFGDGERHRSVYERCLPDN